MRKYIAIALAIFCTLALAGCDRDPVLDNASPAPVSPPPVSAPGAEYDWGITLTAENVTNTGLTLVCTQSGGAPTGDLSTGSFYWVDIWHNDAWVEVVYQPDLKAAWPGRDMTYGEDNQLDMNVAWTSEAWMIPMEDTVRWTVDWAWLYGRLPAGEYRIGKEIMDFRETGDYDTYMAYAYFTIE